MERWNVDGDEKPEMPSENSEAGGLGPNPAFDFLEKEEDLYEDINENVTD